MRVALLAVAWALACAAPVALAAGPTAANPVPAITPAITPAGAAVYLPDAAHQPDRERRQRAVFTLTHTTVSPGAAEPALARVARAVDLFTASGVSTGQLDFVVLLGGGAIDTALSDAAYRALHGVANPNLDVISRLSAHGVKLFVCGQALHARKLEGDLLAAGISISLSTLTSLITLQQQGYALVPL